MTMTIPTADARGMHMDSLRRTATVAGGLYLLTFAASIPARFYFLDPVLSDPGYIVGPGADARVLVGGLLDMVNALACIATAVVLFTVVKRQSETLALGFVTSRLLEAAIIAVGVVSLFTVVTLRQDLAGGAAAAGSTTDRWSPSGRRWCRSTNGPSCSDPTSWRPSTHSCWAP
jgi:hypothetical protein